MSKNDYKYSRLILRHKNRKIFFSFLRGYQCVYISFQFYGFFGEYQHIESILHKSRLFQFCIYHIHLAVFYLFLSSSPFESYTLLASFSVWFPDSQGVKSLMEKSHLALSVTRRTVF